jgi:hypothetical protein
MSGQQIFMTTAPRTTAPTSSMPTDALRGGWLAMRVRDRPGHSISYFGLMLFTALLYFRPQDYSPALERIPFALAAAAFTLAFFLPTQLLLEGRLTARPRELHWLLWLCGFALLSIPLATHRGEAWQVFNDQLVKVIAMFVVMINVVRTPSRWKGLFWVSLAAALFLAANAINDYRTGQTPLEGYRVRGAAGGMFADPNDMALFLITVMPIVFTLLLSVERLAWKLFYGLCLIVLVGGMIFTFSRGGFIGFVFMVGVLAYKLGRGRRLLIGALAYAMRLATITDPSRDTLGSASERQQLLFQSVEVTLKHPLFGVGMGNFYHYTVRGKPSHNAYTQVSADLGLPALAAYLAFILVSLRYLRRIENETSSVNPYKEIHYLAIGLQAALAGYMASSFFLSVAYYWVVYYLVGYAVCLRRIYETGPGRVLGRIVPQEAEPERRRLG